MDISVFGESIYDQKTPHSNTIDTKCFWGILVAFAPMIGFEPLFVIVMDRMTDDIIQEAPSTMMFADDIVICSDSKEQV